MCSNSASSSATPKANGYKSLHAIIEVPVFLSTGRVDVAVEVQFRTIAMNFWASLEHKIYYKYRTEVPGELARQLLEAAESAARFIAWPPNGATSAVPTPVATTDDRQGAE